MHIPTIKTDRLILRPFTEHDAEGLHRILAQEGVLRYFPSTDPPPLDRVQKFIVAQLARWEEHGFGWWAVEPKSKGGIIGWNGLQYLTETEEVEIAYLLAKPPWGKGLATEGAREGLKYGFETLELERIVGIVHPENIASQRVLEKLGLTFANEAEYFGMNVYRYVIDIAAYTRVIAK
jgi:ribosomal-protein-alanine N-acetyltransferase